MRGGEARAIEPSKRLRRRSLSEAAARHQDGWQAAPAAVGFCDSPIDPRRIFLLSLVPYLAISAVLSDIKRGQATDWAGGLRLPLLF